MKNYKNRFTALLLVLGLLAGLTACGKQPEEEKQAEQLGSRVYTARMIRCALPLTQVTAMCAVEDVLYLAGQVEESGGGEAEDGAASWSFSGGAPDGGEAFVFSGGVSRPALVRMDPETGEAAELTGYAPGGGEEDVSIAGLVPGGDGTLWVLEERTPRIAFSDGDFSLEAGMEALTAATRRWRKLDAAGAELEALDMTGLAERLGMEEIVGTAVDGDGRICVSGGTGVSVLDPAGQVLFTLTDRELTGELVRLGDGSVGARTAGGTLRRIDGESQSWGTEYVLTGSAVQLCAGDASRAFCYTSGDSFYAWPAGGTAAGKLLSWSGVGIDQGELAGVAPLSGDRAAALLAKRNTWPAEYELALLSPSDEAVRDGRTVLTCATLGLDSEMRTRILDFNRTSSRCRIEIRDYSEFNTGDDPLAGLTKLSTEIAAGSVPDLLDTSSGIPVRQYGAKGLLEDLWPYIEDDPDLGRTGVMERVLQAAGTGGALYQVFATFGIQTAAGDPAIVGDRTGWTLAELREALAKLPGASVLGEEETRMTVLRTLFAQNLDQYLDWSSGTARFDSQEFRSVLDFCAGFPDQARGGGDDVGVYTRIASGEQLLLPVELTDFTGIQLYKELFGGRAALVGYPRQGGCGASFTTGCGMALARTCGDREGAWTFLRTLLLPADEDTLGLYGFPVNRESFERMMEKSMEEQYVTDENGELYLGADGEPVLQSTGIWFVDGRMIEMRPATREECGQILSLYDETDAVTGCDETVWAIVQECAAAYFAGDKTAEETAAAIQSRVVLYMNEQL